MEPYGDADPGISADGQTVYSSRGLSPLPAHPTQTLRHLYAYSSAAYAPGKVENDLSIATKPDCTVGVTLTNLAGSSWTFIATGFGPDWNPAMQP
jgi:hypothetical protein